MSAKYKSPSFLLPNEINTNTNPLNTDGNPATGTGINSLYSMDFDGTNYIDLGDSVPPFNQTTSKFSISFWLNRENTTTNRCVFENRGSSYDSGISLEIRPGNAVFYFWIYPSTGGGTITTFPISSVPINQWNHIAIVFDGTQTGNTNRLKIYVNNTSLTLTYLSNVPANVGGSGTGDNFRLAEGLQANFQGKMDEFCIFNKSLNSTDISALWNGGSPASAATVINLGASAYYPLGEQAQMQGYLGNEASSEWQFPNGVLQDYVMDFDGVNDFIDLGNLQPSTTSLSISAWAYKTDTSNASIIGRGSSVDYGIFVYSGSLQFGINAGGWTTISTTLPVNQWFHVLATWDGTTMKLYVNGGTPVTASKTGTITYTSNNTTIGKNSTLSGFEWDGKISNVAIWNTDQSTNIANIYNNGSPQTTYTVTPQNWWKLNADSVYTPSAPNYTTALDFDSASSDYLQVPNSTDFDFGTGDFTWSLWVNYETHVNYAGLLVTGTSNSEYRLKFQLSGQILFMQNADGDSQVANLGTNITGTGWHHLCLVRNSGTITTYLDGSAVDTNSRAGNVNSNGNDLEIGRNGGAYFNGKLSNVAIYKTALTSSQVSTLFNFGTPETAISFSPTAWWKLDNTTTGIQDSSGNGNNGTNNGTAQLNSSVAFVPSWKIPTALTIPSINYTKSLDFDPSGSGDYISFGNQSAFKPTSNYTFSIWFNGDSASYALFGTNSNTGTGVHALLTGSKILYYHGNQLVLNVAHAGLNIWQNFIVTWSSSTGIIRTFIDGRYVDQRTGVNSITWSNDLEVGRINSGQWKYDGKLSNFAMWNTTLTDGFSGTPTQGNVAGGQVAEVYNNGQPQASITGSPVGWWKLNDQNTITDYSGNNYTGTNNGAVDASGDVTASGFNIPVNGVSTTLPSTALQQSDLQFDSPYSNYSLSFDGATNYIDCTNYQFSTTKTSISAWFKSSDTRSTEFTEILSKYSDTSPEFQMRLNTGTTKTLSLFFLQSGTTYVICTTTSTWNDGNWHNVIFTYDSSFASGKLYIDGTLEASDTTTSGVHTPGDANLYIGARQSNSIEKEFLGNIDEVSIWKGTYLSEAQVLEIYNNGKPSNLENFSGTLPSSWWRLGENAYFDNNAITVPNSITGAPNGIGPGTVVNMLSADAPGTYANGVGSDLDIIDRVGDAPLSIANSQSYNMIPDDKVPYVPGYVGDQISNTYSMTFDGTNYFGLDSSLDLGQTNTISFWIYYPANGFHIVTGDPLLANNYGIFINNGSNILYRTTTGYNLFAPTPTLNAWTHLAFTKNNNDTYGKMYFNGVEQSIVAGSQNIRYGVTKFNTIGAKPDGSSALVGKLDEFAVWDKELTADQIKFDLYNATTTGKTADIANNPNLPTPVAWYRMGD